MEKLSLDILEDDFIKVFAPIHWVQYVTGFQRVIIKHKYVTPPPVTYQFYSSIMWIINVLSSIYFVFNCECKLESTTNKYAFQYGIFFEIALNAINAFRNNFTDGNRNSQLYVKLQRVDRILQMHETAKYNQLMFYLTAPLTVTIFTVWFTAAYMLDSAAKEELCPALYFTQFTGVALYFDIILAAVILLYLSLRLHRINTALEKEMKKFRKDNKENIISFAVPECYREKERNYDKLVVATHCVLEAWNDLIQLFQFPIFAFTGQIMVWDFTLMQNVVEAIRDKNMNLNYIVVSSVTLFLAMTSIFGLCVLANLVISKTQMTRKICLKVLAIQSGKGGARDHYIDNLQKNAQHILILLETLSTFSIYDIYTVDNRLPLHMFAITATYTIVLLQFATL